VCALPDRATAKTNRETAPCWTFDGPLVLAWIERAPTRAQGLGSFSAATLGGAPGPGRSQLAPWAKVASRGANTLWGQAGPDDGEAGLFFPKASGLFSGDLTAAGLSPHLESP
jgi:hypothetical protein